MRIVFLGTPEFAVPTLQKLLASPHEVITVITQPDRARGRGRRLIPPPVKQVACAAKITVLQPLKIAESNIVQQLRALRPDCAVVVAYGQILPPQILKLPKYGCLNVHASLLPKYRGAAPINWAIIRGETKTGVSIMLMDEGLDTGDILAQAEIDILAEDTAGSLQDKLAQVGAELLLSTLTQLEAGRICAQPQDEAQASYAPMLKKEDGLIDWGKEAVTIERLVRGLYPWPGAYTYIEGRLIKLIQVAVDDKVPVSISATPGLILAADHTQGLVVATGRGRLRLLKIQPEGRSVMRASEYLAGLRYPLAGKVCSPAR